MVGKPPFETSCLKDTYAKIKKNEYQIPSRVSSSARNLIQKLLQPDPSSRPSMEQVLEDDFFSSGEFSGCLQKSERLLITDLFSDELSDFHRSEVLILIDFRIGILHFIYVNSCVLPSMIFTINENTIQLVHEKDV